MGRIRPYKPRKNLLDRLMSKVMPEPNSGCWLWLAATDGRNGYGRLKTRTTRQAHRASYELHIGPIPSGLVLDHKCRNPSCVNPDHLEPVTQIENLRRGNYRNGLALGGRASGAKQRSKTHCPQGHPYEPGNLRASKLGFRNCLTCHRLRARAAKIAAATTVPAF